MFGLQEDTSDHALITTFNIVIILILTYIYLYPVLFSDVNDPRII